MTVDERTQRYLDRTLSPEVRPLEDLGDVAASLVCDEALSIHGESVSVERWV